MTEEKKSDIWMAFYIGAYLADTMHLGREHHGSYLLLIMAAFKNAGWLPNDDTILSQIAKCTPRQWKNERALFSAFFRVTHDRWTHKRVTVEWKKAQAMTEQRREAGRASALSRRRALNDRSTEDELPFKGRSTTVQIPLERDGRPSQTPSTGGAPKGGPPTKIQQPSPPVAEGALALRAPPGPVPLPKLRKIETDADD